jgi:hypothetical protein
MKRWQLGSLMMLLLSILAACGRPDAATSETLFQLKLKQGETYRTLMTMKQTTEQSLFGKSQNITATTAITLRYTVSQVDADGTMHMDVSYEQVSLEQEAPTGAVKYDSANPSANQNADQIATIYDKLIGQTISMQFAPSGEIKNVAGFDAIIDAMMETFPDGPMREQMRQMMTDMFEQSMTGNSGNLAIFPAQPIKVGDSWPQKTAMSASIFKIALDSTYTLTERKDGIATIAVDAVGTFLPGESSEMMGMKMNINMQGGQTGSLFVDEATGWTVRSEIQQNFAGTLGVGDPASNSDMTMTIPMTMTTLITTEPKP